MTSPVRKVEFFSKRKTKLKGIIPYNAEMIEPQVREELKKFKHKWVIMVVTHEDDSLSLASLEKSDRGYIAKAATGELSYLMEDGGGYEIGV